MSLELVVNDIGIVSSNDFVRLFLGKKLGYGEHRDVYAHDLDPRYVLKIERQACLFANVSEWDIWNNLRHGDFKEWLAPCIAISPNGIVLVQARTEPVKLEDIRTEVPKVPAFLTDLKVQNWGRLDGRIVCHDYGNHRFYGIGATKRMRKADWWSHEP